MRLLSMAGLLSALTTLVAALALRAAEATLAVAAVATLAILLGWYAQLHSDEERSGLGVANPASAVTLAVVGRRPWATLLPAVAAHVVGAVLGGLAALVLEDRLGDTIVFAQPGLVVAAVGGAVTGLVVAWTTLAVDGGGHEALSGIPAVVGGAVLPLGLLTVFHPASLVGLATAGLVPWDVAVVAAGSGMIAAGVGGYAVAVLVPQE